MVPKFVSPVCNSFISLLTTGFKNVSVSKASSNHIESDSYPHALQSVEMESSCRDFKIAMTTTQAMEMDAIKSASQKPDLIALENQAHAS